MIRQEPDRGQIPVARTRARRHRAPTKPDPRSPELDLLGTGSGRRAAPERARDACPRRAGAPAIRATTAGTATTAADTGPETTAPSNPATTTVAVRRRLVGAVVLATATVTIVLAVPPLRGVARQITHMEPAWVAVAVALELASCAGYVVIFRLFFDKLPAGIARELAWTEEASGALLPTGGVGALAIGGWMLRRAGMSTRMIVERSSALFFLTSGVNVAALVGGGVMLSAGVLGGRNTVVLAGIPIGLGVIPTVATLAVPVVLRRAPQRTGPTWLVDLAAGIDGARLALRRPHWRLLGAIGYLGFDIAALGAAFVATGHAVPVDTLVLGYIIGYLANLLPVPGGFGVLEAGLAGTLIAYGAPATQAAAAVVVYHAIAFWIPSLGGLIGYAWLRRRTASERPQAWSGPVKLLDLGVVPPTVAPE